jgi:CRP/FNR family cyclic AMP-dependent transcriptional regulator
LRDFWHLNSFDWLEELSVEELEKLRANSSSQAFEAGDVIFEPESEPHDLYLLESGIVRIYRISEEGNETTFGYVAPGEVFGELVVFGDFSRDSYAAATRSSRVLRVASETFRELLEARPELALVVVRQIGSRFKRIEKRVEHLVFRDARARVAQILIELAEDFGRDDEGQRVIEIDITQAELATLVGITRQTANSCLRELEVAEITGRRAKHIVVRDPERLKAIVDGSPPAASGAS